MYDFAAAAAAAAAANLLGSGLRAPLCCNSRSFWHTHSCNYMDETAVLLAAASKTGKAVHDESAGNSNVGGSHSSY